MFISHAETQCKKRSFAKSRKQLKITESEMSFSRKTRRLVLLFRDKSAADYADSTD